MKMSDMGWGNGVKAGLFEYALELIEAIVSPPRQWGGDPSYAAEKMLLVCKQVRAGRRDEHVQSLAAEANEILWDFDTNGAGPGWRSDDAKHEPLLRASYVLNGLVLSNHHLFNGFLTDLDSLAEFDPCRDLRLARWWVKLMAPAVQPWSEKHAAAVAAVLAGERALAHELLHDPGTDHVR